MPELDRPSVRRAMRLGVAEGAAFALMVGMGETYFLANAVRLEASPILLGWMVSLPLCVGAAGPVAALAAMRRIRSRKLWAVASAIFQAAIVLSISLLDRAGALTIALLLGAVCLYQVAGMSTGTAWSSWFGDLVPGRMRGRYFARRSRWVQVSILVGVVASGMLLQWLEPGRGSASTAAGAGFQLVFAIAAGARLLSALLLALSPEPPFSGLSPPRKVLRYLGTDRGSGASRILLTAAALQLATYVASPYFTPFMLQELHFSYLEYMVATIFVVVGKFFVLPTWGRAIDAYGARPVYVLIALMVAMVPVPWLWARNLWWVLPAQLLSGATWSGYEVSFFSLLLDSSYKRTRAYIFAAQNVLNGSAQLVGATLGGWLFGALGGNFRLVFGTSLVLRLMVALMAPRTLPPRSSAHPGRRDLALRLVGFRPAGGVAHRPILEGDGTESADDEPEPYAGPESARTSAGR